MNTTDTPTPTPTTAAKTKRTRTPKVRTPRTIDPEIKRLRDEHKEKVAALKIARNSTKVLAQVKSKCMNHLRSEDIKALAEWLSREAGVSDSPSTDPRT